MNDNRVTMQKKITSVSIGKKIIKNVYSFILNCIIEMWNWVNIKRGRNTNGEIGLVANQIYEKWNCTIFVIWIFRGKSKPCKHTKHLLLIIDLHEQQAYKFVQLNFRFSQNWQFCTPIIVNISIPPPLDPKKKYIYI